MIFGFNFATFLRLRINLTNLLPVGSSKLLLNILARGFRLISGLKNVVVFDYLLRFRLWCFNNVVENEFLFTLPVYTFGLQPNIFWGHQNLTNKAFSSWFWRYPDTNSSKAVSLFWTFHLCLRTDAGTQNRTTHNGNLQVQLKRCLARSLHRCLPSCLTKTNVSLPYTNPIGEI